MSRSHTATIPLLFTLGAADVELFARVTFTYHPGDKRRCARPTDIDPPEGPSVEDVTVTHLAFDRGGAAIPVPPGESDTIADGIDRDTLIAAALDDESDARERAAEDRAERAREDREHEHHSFAGGSDD